MSVTIDPEDSSCSAPLQVIREVAALREELNANRRWFHAHPELSFQEVQTAKKVSERASEGVCVCVCVSE